MRVSPRKGVQFGEMDGAAEEEFDNKVAEGRLGLILSEDTASVKLDKDEGKGKPRKRDRKSRAKEKPQHANLPENEPRDALLKLHAVQPAAKKGPKFAVIPDVFEVVLYPNGAVPAKYDQLYNHNGELEHFFEGDMNADKIAAHAGFRALFEKLKAMC